jgi:RNA polymerase sigma-70 factor (ECF subfamily)
MNSRGAWRVLPTRANGQPATVGYVQAAGETVFRPFVIGVLGIEGDRLVSMTAFEDAHLVSAFGLPATL